MKSVQVLQHRQRLDSLFKRMGDFTGDPELQAYWAQFLCVLASGYIESSVRYLFTEYTQRRASPFVANFIGEELKSFQNAKSEKILQLARKFSPDWETKIVDFMKDKRKDAIDSIVSNRHNIAHGRNVGITFARIQAYYKSTVEVIDFIEELLA
jgi:hypothetical protein